MKEYAEFRCNKQELEMISAKMSDINKLHAQLLSMEKDINVIKQWINSSGSSLLTTGMSIKACDCSVCASEL